MNARIQIRESPEEHCVGPYTFRPDMNRLATQSEDAANNRVRLISFCINYSLDLVNTFFRKQQQNLATFREIANNHGPPYDRNRYEHFDYCLTTTPNRRHIYDAYTDPACYIPSDHIPLVTAMTLTHTDPPWPFPPTAGLCKVQRNTEREVQSGNT